MKGCGPHFDSSGYTVATGINLTDHTTLNLLWQKYKVAQEVLLQPGDLYILRGKAVHTWQHRLSAPHQQNEANDRVVLHLRYISLHKLK